MSNPFTPCFSPKLYGPAGLPTPITPTTVTPSKWHVVRTFSEHMAATTPSAATTPTSAPASGILQGIGMFQAKGAPKNQKKPPRLDLQKTGKRDPEEDIRRASKKLKNDGDDYIEKVEGVLRNLREDISDREAQIRDLNDQLKKEQKKVADIAEKNNYLVSELASAHAEIDEHQREIKEKTNTMASLAATATKGIEENIALQSNAEKLKEQLRELEAGRKKDKDKISQLGRSLERRNKKLAEMEESAETSKTENDLLRDENDSKSERITDLEHALNLLDAVNKSVRSKTGLAVNPIQMAGDEEN